MPARRFHRASLDRIGLALTAGGVVCGLGVALLAAIGRQLGSLELLALWGAASVLAMPALALLFGLPWLLLVRRQRTGPVAAMITGSAAAALLVLGLQWHPELLGGATAGYRWLSAILTALAFAVPGGVTALLMWRIAYRTLG